MKSFSLIHVLVVCACALALCQGCAYSFIEEISSRDEPVPSMELEQSEFEGGVVEAVSDRDADGVSDDEDACPDDPQKIEPGLCRCGVSDELYDGIDSDGDGVVDCADACPYQKTKLAPLQSGCSVPDSDGDGFDDVVDACPTNPHVHEKLDETVSYVETCLIDDERNLHIYASQDLNDVAQAENINAIYLEADINLNVRNSKLSSKNDSCDRSIMQPIYYEPVRIYGNNHTIKNETELGERCVSDQYLFQEVTGVSDLIIDLDYDGAMVAGLARYGSGTLKNITYRGLYHYAGIIAHSGGLFSELKNCQIDNVTTDQAEFIIDESEFGVIAYSIKNCKMNYTRPIEITRLIGKHDVKTYVYGIAVDVDVVENIKLNIGVIEGNGAGVCAACKLYDSEIEIGRSKYASGLMVDIIGYGGVILDNVELIINEIEEAYPVAIQASSFQKKVSEIRNLSTQIKGVLRYNNCKQCWGGMIGYVMLFDDCQENMSIHQWDNHVARVELSEGSFYGGLIGMITHNQMDTNLQLSVCTGTSYASIKMDHINSKTDMVMRDGDGVVGGLFGEISYFMLDDDMVSVEELPRIHGTVSLSNIYSAMNVITKEGAAIGQIVGQLSDNTDDGYLSYGEGDEGFVWKAGASRALPAWPAYSLEAAVFGGSVRGGTFNGHLPLKMVGKYATYASENYTELNYKNTYVYNYVDKLSYPEGVESLSYYKEDEIDAFIGQLKAHSELWGITKVTNDKNQVIKMPYLNLQAK